jgi:glycosyltransferase involved in cell wall biosynthesis
MKHSIIIPTFNRKQTILRAIKSVLNQTVLRDYDFLDNHLLELIIIDDGSTDSTSELVQNLIPKKIRGLDLIYKKTNHLGVSHARNFGVDKSEGDWIYFLDSDDEWLPTKLRVQISFHSLYKDYLISQTEEFWIRNGVKVNQQIKHQKISDNIFKESLYQCMITPSSVCLHRSLWNKFKGFDLHLKACEDYDLWLKISNIENIGLINEKLLNRYGGHNDQLSFLYPAMDRFRIYSMLNGWSSWKNLDIVKKALGEKINILKLGMKKRGKETIVFDEILIWIEKSSSSPPAKNWLSYCLDDSNWNKSNFN